MAYGNNVAIQETLLKEREVYLTQSSVFVRNKQKESKNIW